MANTSDKNVIGLLLEASQQANAQPLHDMGVGVGRLYTDHGLPIDMALAKLELSKEETIQVLNGALWWLVEHRRQSGATPKAVDRQRKANRQIMERFLQTGETGVY